MAVPRLELDSAYIPTADQPAAIASLAEGVEAGERFTTVLGATGTGKTMTMAATVEAVQKPALVIAHNKTLAAQDSGSSCGEACSCRLTAGALDPTCVDTSGRLIS